MEDCSLGVLHQLKDISQEERWYGIDEKTRDLLYKIASTSSGQDAEPIITIAARRILQYKDPITRCKLSCEFESAVTYHEIGRPDLYLNPPSHCEKAAG